jgi:predicted secreted hydrolase
MAMALLAGLAAPQGGQAQGFAGMGTSADGYALPDPAYRFTFPRDHGPHTDFRIEWWYVTANLTGADGTDYGLQWTLFRSALSPLGGGEGWDSAQFWMGHAAVTTPDSHYATERFARGGIGQAGVTAAPFSAWIDDWRMTGIETGRLTASGPDFAYDLAFATDRPFVPQGKNGFSVKSTAGQASHYYSQPFYEVTGTLDLPGGPVAVTGTAWLDREWSSQPLTDDQTGWDWFSLHFDTGEKLMGYRLRSNRDPAYTVATWIDPDGTPSPYAQGALTATPLNETRVAGRDIPTRWRLVLPARGLDITVAALNPDSWMDTAVSYWEGPVRAEGSHPGRGYLEMTGYE